MDLTQVGDVLKVVYDKFLVSVFILLIGFILGKITGKLVESLLKGFDIDKLLKRVDSNLAFDKALSQICTYVIFVITILILLQYLGIRNLVLIVLLVIFSAILIFSVSFAVIMFLPNFLFGLFIKRKLKKGDFIIVDSINGRIVKMRFSDIFLESKDDILALPYSYIRKMFKN